MNNIIVTEASTNIRAMAREALAGKWKVAAVATLVYFIAVMLPTTILNLIFGGETGYSGLSTLYTLIVMGPFTVGYSLFCLNVFRNKEIEVAQVFYGFERFLKAFGLCFIIGLILCLWSIPCIISVIIAALKYKIFYLVAIILLIPVFIVAYRYSQAFVIMIDYPEYGIMQNIAESKRLMTGNKMKFFLLALSFIGWILLAIVPATILGGIIGFMFPYSMSGVSSEIVSYIGMIGFIWLQPYMTVSNVAFYEMANGNLRVGYIKGNATIFDDKFEKAETFVEGNTEESTSENTEPSGNTEESTSETSEPSGNNDQL